MNQMANRTVCVRVKNLLPSVLIDYLWTLAGEAQTEQDFVLTKQTLGGKELQEVRHLSDGLCKAVHRVFGFEPVNAGVFITMQGDGARMEAVSLPELAGPRR